MSPDPLQFSTGDGTLFGALDGLNRQYSFVPYQATLRYSAINVTGHILFRNGVLIDEYIDYAAGTGVFALTGSAVGDNMTALLYNGPGVTTMRLSDSGLTAYGTTELRVTPQTNPAHLTPIPYMLFRNGILLTPGFDYTLNGPWATLLTTNIIDPSAGDTYVALIGLIGTQSSTFNSTITGAVNGTNAAFILPAAAEPVTIMLFRNGQFLTESIDYTRSGAQVTLLGDQIPQPGDLLTGQVIPAHGPTQISTVTGTMTLGEVSAKSVVFRDGLLMAQPLDAVTSGNAVTFAVAQVPQTTDIATVEAWVSNVLDPDQPALNLPQQFSTTDGSIAGAGNTWVVGTTALITQMLLWWNKNFLVQGLDYSYSGNQITFITPELPLFGDDITAEVFLS